jgi:hypothetical protein
VEQVVVVQLEHQLGLHLVAGEGVYGAKETLMLEMLVVQGCLEYF